MKKMLVVDDEEKIRSLIRKYAEFEGFSVTEAGDGREAVALCEYTDFDMVIMDIMMPELDGFSACKQIFELGKTPPVLMLSARGEEYDKIHGFELGIDDYVVKPFSPRELMLRVNAILKRGQISRGETERDIFMYQGLSIDFTARTVAIDKKKIELAPKEYELLFYLAKHPNIALTRQQILSNVWGYNFFGEDRTLDTHIKLLRNDLGQYRKLIVTIRGVGYRFEIETDRN